MLEDYKHIGSFFRKASATARCCLEGHFSLSSAPLTIHVLAQSFCTQAVGDALRERLQRDPKAFDFVCQNSLAFFFHFPPGQAPFWLNTEGSGVAWLHVRIDPTPKHLDINCLALRCNHIFSCV